VPLSNTEVITRLNRYFVPVYLANEDYREGGSAPAEEKAELRRIHAEGHAAKLSVGTVHAYVLRRMAAPGLHACRRGLQRPEAPCDAGPDGGEAGDAAGRPGGEAGAQSAAKAEPGNLLLHVTARYLERKGDEYALVEMRGGNWSAFPGEAWITLERAEWAKLLPPAAARVGDSWEIDRQTAARILNHFYPPTENNDLSKNQIQEQSLKGTVISVRGRHCPRSHRRRAEDEAPVLPQGRRQVGGRGSRWIPGLDTGKRQIRSLLLVTEDAVYGGATGAKQPFGVAVRLQQ
jgi:hypothetical protein